VSQRRTITVELPEGLDPSADDLEVLRTTFGTILSLTRQCGSGPCAELQDMLDSGWEVRWGVTWLVSAQRGMASEEATGVTREDALQRLQQMICLHEADGCP